MTKTITTLAIFTVMLSFSACKKCYHCYNSCQQCSIVINSHTFTNTYCVDSFATKAQFDAAISADTAIGYTCAETAPTYEFDYCANQAGKESYLNYFNKSNRATCNEK